MTKRLICVLMLAASVLLSGCAAVVVGGAATAAAVAADRRQPDIVATDERIELTANQRIEPKAGPNGHVNVTSFNRVVLLTGEVPTSAIKAEAEAIAAAVPDVRHVVNELAVAPATSMESRSKDTYITGQVKARMVSGQKFNPLHVKVVTELANVYLMGLVTEKEAADAAAIAANTSGVRKVVRVFEYIPVPPAH
ncbi:MAG TPA: BON domain-containing protein [Burkholderiales bacterium]|jgi:osmotically-inducible protein OsmY|nr:BON domain-containing protein [Burkholderiales bacterium]